MGGQLGKNSQKLHENDKIGILGSKQWGDMGGDKPIFRVGGGGIPPSPPLVPPTRGNPDMYTQIKSTKTKVMQRKKYRHDSTILM